MSHRQLHRWHLPPLMICAFGALLTNGLFRRDKQRAGAVRPTFSAQTETTRSALPGLASRKNPVLWAFFRVFMWPVNRQTAFRNKYLRPQELPALGNRLLEAVSQSWMGEGGTHQKIAESH